MHKVAVLAMHSVAPFDLSIRCEVFDRAEGPHGEPAYQLLEATGLPVDEVSAGCGFQPPATFRARFKRPVGASPTAYRRAFNARGGARGPAA